MLQQVRAIKGAPRWIHTYFDQEWELLDEGRVQETYRSSWAGTQFFKGYLMIILKHFYMLILLFEVAADDGA